MKSPATIKGRSGTVELPVAVVFLCDAAVAVVAQLVGTLRAKLMLRWLGCRYGPKLCVDGKLVVRARRMGSIKLGQGVRINCRFMSNLVGLTGPTVLHCLGGGRIEIGDHTGISGAILSARHLVQIGNRVSIGGNVRIYDHDFHALDWEARRQGEAGQSAPVVIGDDVFIGANTIILKGVHIGERCVIGAGAVVTLKDIPPDSLVAGNPGRIVRTMPG